MVDVVHQGHMALKGVAQPVSVLLLVPLMLSGRIFPPGLPGSKARLVGAPRGLQCSVKAEA